jgi:hypothetical protein
MHLSKPEREQGVQGAGRQLSAAAAWQLGWVAWLRSGSAGAAERVARGVRQGRGSSSVVVRARVALRTAREVARGRVRTPAGLSGPMDWSGAPQLWLQV